MCECLCESLSEGDEVSERLRGSEFERECVSV